MEELSKNFTNASSTIFSEGFPKTKLVLHKSLLILNEFLLNSRFTYIKLVTCSCPLRTFPP